MLRLKMVAALLVVLFMREIEFLLLACLILLGAGNNGCFLGSISGHSTATTMTRITMTPCA